MKNILLLTMMLLSACTSSVHPSNYIVPEPNKPKLSHIEWSDVIINGKHLYAISDNNMDVLNNNLIDLLEYERKQQLLIKYYENLQK